MISGAVLFRGLMPHGFLEVFWEGFRAATRNEVVRVWEQLLEAGRWGCVSQFDLCKCHGDVIPKSAYAGAVLAVTGSK